MSFTRALSKSGKKNFTKNAPSFFYTVRFYTFAPDKNLRGKICTDCNLIKKMLKQDPLPFSRVQSFPFANTIQLWHIYLRQNQ